MGQKHVREGERECTDMCMHKCMLLLVHLSELLRVGRESRLPARTDVFEPDKA